MVRKNGSRRIPWWVVSMLLIAGCTQEKKTAQSHISSMQIPVKVQVVNTVTGSTTQYYIGTVEELQSLKLSFPIGGNVKQVLFSEGQHVKRGQVLAVLNNENYQSTYDAAVAKEKQAQDGYDRLSSVYKNGSLPEVKFVEIETGLQQAKSVTKITKKNLDDCVLHSPIDGVIGKRLIEPGMNALPDNPVLTVVKIEKIFVKVAVPEFEIAHTNIGQHATIKVAALDNAEYTGTIEEKGVIADMLSHTYPIKIIVDNKDELLKPGMVCKVWMNLSKVSEKMIIPQYAVLSGVDGKYVYVIGRNNSNAAKKFVETGSLCKDGIVIVSGLQSGERVVVEGYQKLFNGAAVIIQ